MRLRCLQRPRNRSIDRPIDGGLGKDANPGGWTRVWIAKRTSEKRELAVVFVFGCHRHPRQPPSFLVMPLRNKIRQREFVCYRQLLSLPLSWCVRWCRGLPDGRQPLFFFKPEFFESPQTIRGEMRYLAWRLIIAPNFSKCFRSCDVIAAPDDLERAFAQFIREKVEAVLVPLDSTRPSVPIGGVSRLPRQYTRPATLAHPRETDDRPQPAP